MFTPSTETNFRKPINNSFMRKNNSHRVFQVLNASKKKNFDEGFYEIWFLDKKIHVQRFNSIKLSPRSVMIFLSSPQKISLLEIQTDI